MHVQQEGFFDRAVCVQFLFDVFLNAQHTFSEKGREFRIRKYPARRFYEARRVRRSCRTFSHSRSTGSPSNAILAATWRGTSAHRRALRSAGFNLRHRETFSCHVMPTTYMKAQQLKGLLLPMHLGRDFQAQAVQADKSGGVVLVVGLGRVGFHGRDVRIVKTHARFAAGDDDVALV